jgi:hypothetical protein
MTPEQLEEIRQLIKYGVGPLTTKEVVAEIRAAWSDIAELKEKLAYVLGDVYTERDKLQAERDDYKKALERIAEHKGKTQLAECCVHKNCKPHWDDGEMLASCTWQFGVSRGFGEMAEIAREALRSIAGASQKDHVADWLASPEPLGHIAGAGEEEK